MDFKEKEGFEYHEYEEPDSGLFPEMGNVSSATESTGMMPTPAGDQDAYHAYQDLAGMAIPKKAPGKSANKEKRRLNGALCQPEPPRERL